MPEVDVNRWLGQLAAASGWWASALRIVLIVGLAWLLTGVLQRAIRKVRERVASRFEDREAVKRAETLGRVLRYIVAVVVTLVAGMLVLAELGVSLAPILGAAGVVGVAVGFGAQSLVRDYFNGLFLLLEDQIHQGDVVRLGEHAGLVEEMTLRYVRLRDYDGYVHFVSNGQIASVVNMGRGHAQAVIDIGIAYGEAIDRAMQVMVRTAEQLRADPEFSSRILDAFEMVGVERWADSAVILRARFKVAPLEQWSVRREYLRRLKAAFDTEGIEIPFPQLTVHSPKAWPAAGS
ncbi:MAG: mechanosensitive ion channel family protein [Rubrivivax sp.]|nr:mechanosensitive ion channel family protein [Rubrivivax sp.]